MRSLDPWYSASRPPFDLDSWKNVYRERHQNDNLVRMLFEEMVEDSRNRIRHMDGIVSVGMVQARDVLDNFIAGREGEQRDLTRMYYARKMLKRLRRGWVLDQWRAYRLNQQRFPIWQGCGLMAMFSDHELELTDIDRQFQDMADEFLAKSPPPDQVYGNSSTAFLSSSPGYQDERRSESVRDLHIRRYDDQIERLQQLIRYFTEEKGFKGNTDNYFDPFNSFIDKVFSRKVGIPIMLCIVFAELAQRVGIDGLELMAVPQNFMIRYRPSTPTPFRTQSPAQESNEPSPAAPTYYLDLFHPPHHLLTTAEYEDHLSRLNIPLPDDAYRNFSTPDLEIFLRCLRNIILAVEQTGGVGRIGSDHQTSLYSGITQLLTLHPSEEWSLYVLWLNYLKHFWPEDTGFIRMSIEDMEIIEHRRSVARGQMSFSSQNQQGSRHVFGYQLGNFFSSASAHSGSTTHETIKILRTKLRELEMADEAGDVGQIRRRRRPKVVSITPEQRLLSSPSPGSDQDEPLYSALAPPTSSPTIDSQSSISGEQQSEANGTTSVGADQDQHESPPQVPTTFAASGHRKPEPKFYVGEVFRHIIYRYTGVIFGYDLKCEADERWIGSMGIDALERGRHQPFYNALLTDGSRRYVAEDNIQVLYREYREPASPVVTADQTPPTTSHDPQDHPASDTISAVPAIPDDSTASNDTQTGTAPSTSNSRPSFQFSELGPLEIEAVGQYFEAWDGNRGHYVMNKELRKVYPTEDYQ